MRSRSCATGRSSPKNSPGGSSGNSSFLLEPGAADHFPAVPSADPGEDEALGAYWNAADAVRVLAAIHAGTNGTDAVNEWMEDAGEAIGEGGSPRRDPPLPGALHHGAAERHRARTRER